MNRFPPRLARARQDPRRSSCLTRQISFYLSSLSSINRFKNGKSNQITTGTQCVCASKVRLEFPVNLYINSPRDGSLVLTVVADTRADKNYA
jgi:hypothetical protein